MSSIPSPNFNDRADHIPLAYIVLHYTGMQTAEAARARMTDPAAEVSAHYLIDEDGSILSLVDENHRAWHAGKGKWQGVTDMNSASLGIELVNPGHEFGYRPFPAPQICALVDLLKQLVHRHKLNPTRCLIAHSDFAPTRKQDPGEFFPWEELAKNGLGLWPETHAEDYAPQASNQEPASLLHHIGYDTENLPAAIAAFQRRFRPDRITGEIDPDTLARLRAIARSE